MKKVTAVVIGAGQRGKDAYASYALRHPNEIEFIAVAEPNEAKRNEFKNLHKIEDQMCFNDWKELLEKPQLADAILICTQDQMHFEPAMKALEKGYHVMVEKPMAVDPIECVKMGKYAKQCNRVFLICHVLRYTEFFSSLKRLIDEGKIGKLISIQHNESVGYWHQAHSYVRGNWRDSQEASPMILAKSCHDMDIMLWLAGADCNKISSFGTLTHFTKENAPKGAPKRCLDGCPVENECPYYAPKTYLTENTGWPTSVISEDTSLEARIKALKEGPYGRCVYHCDNNVVDHQVVNMEFENEVTAVFTMCAFTGENTRTIKLMGTKGEIRGHMGKNEIEVIDFTNGRRTLISIKKPGGHIGHGGGDEGLMRDFVRLVQKDGQDKGLTSANISVQSHLMAFAAEEARKNNCVINMETFSQQFQ